MYCELHFYWSSSEMVNCSVIHFLYSIVSKLYYFDFNSFIYSYILFKVFFNLYTIFHTLIVLLLFTTSLTQIKVIIRSSIHAAGVKKRKIKLGKLEMYHIENVEVFSFLQHVKSCSAKKTENNWMWNPCWRQ